MEAKQDLQQSGGQVLHKVFVGEEEPLVRGAEGRGQATQWMEVVSLAELKQVARIRISIIGCRCGEYVPDLSTGSQ